MSLERLVNRRARERCPEAAKHVDRLAVIPNDLIGDEPRVSGLVICSICNRDLYDHPQHPHEPWMTVTCEGKSVKL